MVNLYPPLGGHIEPAWWTYRATIVSIYTHHAEYIPLPVSPKSWMRWKQIIAWKFNIIVKQHFFINPRTVVSLYLSAYTWWN